MGDREHFRLEKVIFGISGILIRIFEEMLAPVLTKIEKIAIPNFWLNFSRRN
jgi:hypothetical protein